LIDEEKEMTIITTVSGKRIRLRPKKSGPKPLPEGVKKRRINICLSPNWHKVGKEKQPLEGYHFLNI
jgi:hypothetical protein